MERSKTRGKLLWLLVVYSLFFLALPAEAQDCSALSPCATGCCNKNGYCGVGDDYCGADCVASCDYQPECDASRPCASGCCNKFGYCGLGPDFCGDDCVAGCESKSECDPGDYGDYAEASKCPLNVCCSKFGFCGVTESFCGKKKVKRPSCDKDTSLSRVVGYYEGWSIQRDCHVFYPEQIPMGVYTHLNYAFASVDPNTFEVLPATEKEKSLMKRLTDLKKTDPHLKVFIAIGGWTFNDPGLTTTVFSDIAGSESNQAKFSKSLIKFMSTYNFDGVDLDWEYPVADDRGGRKADFDNFPKFLANLKKSLSRTGGRDGISITLPASYWYLQHFDIANLAKHVDFFNIMSYDLHGKWDMGNEWLDPVLNSHTNLTEITNALDLIWRNNITSEKIVLGLAFYARVFSAADPACMEPGCLFVSGGNAGKCSNEVGILLNSEIMDIMDEKSLSSTLDKDAAVKILKFETNQWLTYDNGDTFKLKADFARSQCLGGVMVWAVSHDLPHGNFSRALGEEVGRPASSPQFDEDKDALEVKKTHLQCRWSNCFEDCPSGWSRVRRTGPGARTNEFITDATGCGGAGEHLWCCPPDSPLPKCGWYTHNNGKCNSKCPANTVEIGSNIEYCSGNNNDYQAACCTTDTASMKLYSQCDWAGKAPKCDDGKCDSGQSLLVSSTTGSGGNRCNVRRDTFHYTATGQEGDDQERKYCCNDDSESKWTDCQWRNDVGLASASGSADGFCYSGCPSDRVRVALDQHGGGCKGDGGRAKCCLAKYVTKSKRSYTDAEERMRTGVKDFLKDPSCGIDDYNKKRDWAGIDVVYGNMSSQESDQPLSLYRRFTSGSKSMMDDLIFEIAFARVAGAVALEIWRTEVVPLFPNLTVRNIRTYLTNNLDWTRRGSATTADDIICNLAIFNSKVVAKSTSSLTCEWASSNGCDPADPGICAGEDLDDSPSGSVIITRDLGKRAGRRKSTVNLPNGVQVVWYSLSYRSRGEWPLSNPIWNHAFGYANHADCLDVDIDTFQVTTTAGRSDYDVEHLIEINTIQEFIGDAVAGELPSGGAARNNDLPSAFVEAMNTPMLLNPPSMAGGQASSTPFLRVMNAIGSRRNDVGFLVLLAGLNGCKSRIWRAVSPVDETIMKNHVSNDDPVPGLNDIRQVITVIQYLNDARVQPHMITAANEVRHELALADTEWQAQGNAAANVEDWWDQWIRDRLDHITSESRTWIAEWTKKMRNRWAVRTGQLAMEVMEVLDAYNTISANMEIDTTGLE